MGNVSRSGDELRGDHPIHGSTNGGNYVINTAKNLWHCKRCESGGGAALAIAVKEGLISCSDAAPGVLRGDLFKQVLKIAQEKYGLQGSGPKGEELKGPTVIDAIRLLAGVCDGAKSQDGMGFSKFDRESYNDIIEKAISYGYLSPKEEKTAYRFLKKYKKQLKGLGIDYDKIGRISRTVKDSQTCPTSESGISYDDIIIETDAGNSKLSPSLAADAVLAKFVLRMSSESDDIFRFNGEIYIPDGERVIDGELCGVAGDLCNAYQLRETLRRIKNKLLDRPVVFDPNPYLLGVKNGVADLLTGEVREYRAEDLMIDQLDVSYDPSARCPAFLAFLESITPNVSDRITLIDWFAATAIKESFAYVLFLLGLGRNGKGIYEKLIKRFFGQVSFRDMPLAEVGKNNFAASGFYRKRGWIASETGKKKQRLEPIS